ncbi:TetR family transcriptional regulator [Sphaerisporangium fuscum]|uniref:TetR family transcriptional regulator n=1 Tax=Sphaerisporangium fuscum TaxID=2835868 RepID=UPI001BDCA4A6|nr:TetR family transcriptional regulator [Sphaerisporangium fuscum]
MEGLRERTRQAMRAELAEIALRMFLERGFEETTVDDIAREAGMSKRTFFRYFPSKEDVVFGDADDLGEQVAQEIRARPPGEDPWESLRVVLGRWEGRIDACAQELANLRLIESTPSLKARMQHKRDGLRRRIAEAVRDRPGAELDAFTAELLTGAAGAALDTVAREWMRSGGTADRAALLDRAFTLLAPAAKP